MISRLRSKLKLILQRSRLAANVWRHGLPKYSPPQNGKMAVRDRFAELRHYITTASPVIIDGGAHRGGSILEFLKGYPSATIHSFEPNPHIVAHLQTQFGTNSNIIIHDQALGAENKMIPFKILKHDGASSILPPSSILVHYHGSKMDVTETVEVPLVRMDSVLDQEIDILKLDLQGYELEALRGATNLLPRIKAITIEVEFVPLYDGQPLYGDIDVFLRAAGFRLLNLYELWTHPDGQLTSGDAVYLNTRYFE
ncbi:MAG TPA: FkbM family methyltransferase [Aggregatilineaceae bacterium]|nr:FkbM family methyltransferase [Aggregatilineaceae bacterium]